MSEGNCFKAEPLELRLKKLADDIRKLAEEQRGDSIALLALLRMLEGLHQEIRDGLFQDSLPDNRQALYNLLRDIETTGGWPYIHRMKLQALLTNLQSLQDGEKLSVSPSLSSKNDLSES